MAVGGRKGLGWLVCAAMSCGVTHAQDASVAGAWTGEVRQIGDGPAYSIIMVLTEGGGTTNYPDLNCGGSLRRVGDSNGYVFYTETITRGGLAQGGTCIDGSITVLRAGEGLAWSWTGSDEGAVIVAWSDLRRE